MMKSISIILILLIVGFSNVFGQSCAESITMKKTFGGYQFYQGNKRLTLSQLVKVMKPNDQAFKEIKSAQSTNTTATILGFAGGFMVGWPLGTALAGGEPNWVLAGIGAGLIIVSIPITQKFNKQAKTAVDTFNGGLKYGSFWDKTDCRLTVTQNGIGFTLSF